MEKSKSKTAKKSVSKSASKSTGSSRSSSSSYNTESTENGEQGKFEELFLDSLKDIYWAEKHLTKALGKMQKAATSEGLRDAFRNHQEMTREHVTRLEDAFELIGKKAQAKKCEAMDGLTKEAEEMISETDKGSMTRDVALIMAAQKVEHYEIATYGSLAQLARTMGNNQLAELMDQTLQEEKETDELLTQIAESNVNTLAEAE
ncbi:ferritin-like domain-containing protein [soil metagenome]